MKQLKKCLALLIISLLIVGCGHTDSTDNRLNSPSGTAEDKSDSEGTDVSLVEDTTTRLDVDDTTVNNGIDVDYDLTQMSSDVIYATVYQMMMYPDEYEGKTFRIDGNFYAVYDENNGKYYYYCIIKDAAACCAQGMEFVLSEGSPDYLEEEAKIIVQGTFETYTEDGDSNLYCRLNNATLEEK